MTPDLLERLEQKVAHAVEVIELLRLQIEELEEENITLKAEQEKWRHDLMALIKRFDQIDSSTNTSASSLRTISKMATQTTEEEFLSA